MTRTYTEAHFVRSVWLMFYLGAFAGAFMASCGMTLEAKVQTENIAFALSLSGIGISFWAFMANKGREQQEQALQENMEPHAWITADYLNDLHAQIMEEERAGRKTELDDFE